MVNELGIGRDDIEEWTKEAIREEVAKIVGQINVASIVERSVSINTYSEKDRILEKIAARLATRLELSMKKGGE